MLLFCSKFFSMTMQYTGIRLGQKLLFQPRCFLCGKRGRALETVCFSCRKSLLSELCGAQQSKAILRYRGAVPFLIAALRGKNPLRAVSYITRILQMSACLPFLKEKHFTHLAIAPQTKIREGLYLVGKCLAQEIQSAFCADLFAKEPGYQQHGRSLGSRMDTLPFIRIRENTGIGNFCAARILVLDDVVTTGTTLEICGYLLRAKGVASVQTLALAQDPLPDFSGKNKQPE